MPKLTPELREEYQTLFDTCQVRSQHEAEVSQLAGRLIQNKGRYETLEALTDVPWYIIAVIHNMEASQKFNGHLHNGDPLTARTVQVPPGRPPAGNPPFTFEESGVDAMRFEKMDQVEDWTLPGTLFRLEGFNGFGTRARGINTPYLWSFSNHYTKGKFVKDGKFDPEAVSKQCGAALLLRKMVDAGAFTFSETLPASNRDEVAAAGASVAFSNSNKTVEATRLQKALNRFPGLSVKLTPDGVPGNRTSQAFKDVTGSFLAGDPRV
jgi:lysozyme family protein